MMNVDQTPTLTVSPKHTLAIFVPPRVERVLASSDPSHARRSSLLRLPLSSWIQAMFNTGKQKQLPRHAILSDDDTLARSERITQLGAYDLIPSERFWQERYTHLQERGYILRPRYKPGWKPSWIGTNLDPTFCEDSIMSVVSSSCEGRLRIRAFGGA